MVKQKVKGKPLFVLTDNRPSNKNQKKAAEYQAKSRNVTVSDLSEIGTLVAGHELPKEASKKEAVKISAPPMPVMLEAPPRATVHTTETTAVVKDFKTGEVISSKPLNPPPIPAVPTAPKLETPPPAVGKAVATDRITGYVIESVMDNRNASVVHFTKVLAKHPDTQKWVEMVLFRPAVALPQYAEIEFKMGVYEPKNKLSVLEPRLVTAKTNLAELFAHMQSEEVAVTPTLKAVSIMDLAINYLNQTPIGENIRKQTKNFLDSQGIAIVEGFWNNKVMVRP